MKRILIAIIMMLVLIACSNDAASLRDDQLKSMNDNMDKVFVVESLTNIWHIEDHINEGDSLDIDRLFSFTDEYIVDDENFESLNGYEQGLVMKTTIIISKAIEGKYDNDKELFDKDTEEYYDVLQHGDDTFIKEE